MRNRVGLPSLVQGLRGARYWAKEAREATRRWRESVGAFVVTPDTVPRSGEFQLKISEWSVYRDVLRARLTIERQPGQPRPKHVYFMMGARSLRFRVREGTEQRFTIRVTTPLVGLAVSLSDSRVVEEPQPGAQALQGDASSALFERFLQEIATLPSGKALELGSRARSGTTYRQFVPEHLAYVGLDIVEGPNVDVVGDAHELTDSFDEDTFELVFCIAVFEHLAMPWKAALSINRILKDGGLFFAGTHQTFPVHEAPWDFWRYSDRAWHSLFNKATGFEIVGTALGQPADIVPHATLASVAGIDAQPAFLSSSVLARKIGPPRVTWNVGLADLDDEGAYPN